MTAYRETFLFGYLFDVEKTDLLRNPEGLRRLVRTAAKKSKATVVGTHIDNYLGGGLTATASIRDSLIAVQGWWERRYALVIIHSSYPSMEPENGMNYVIKRLGSRNPRVQRIEGPELPPEVE